VGVALHPANEQALDFSRAGDQGAWMEVTIINRHRNSFGFAKLKKDKIEFTGNVNFSKKSTKEAMFVSNVGMVYIAGKPKLEDKSSTSFNDARLRRPMLKKL